MTVPIQVIEALRAAVGPKGWTDDAQEIAPHLVELRGLWRGATPLLVRPATTAEVAGVVSICARAGVPVVPQGGNTGLVGGAIPNGAILLSLARLNRIRAVDPVNGSMTVEAGCVLADVQRAADEAGSLFPLSLAAEGTCQIGGNLSTNAGGTGVLRYGNARDLVLGLEVVLADGRVWDGLRGLRKNNTGYDLKHLFMGAEGTLGVITAAVLKLFPKPRARETAMAVVADLAAVVEVFRRAQEACGDTLTAFEFTGRLGIDLVLRHMPGTADPFRETHPQYILIELTSPRAGEALRQAIEDVLGRAFDKGLVADAVIASSEIQAAQLWSLREGISEAQRLEGGSIKHDVSIPIPRMPEFVARADAIVAGELPGVRPLAFGHLGDGNIHYNLSQPLGADKDAFIARWKRFNRLIHDLVAELDGSFSAEHGIGQLKLDDMARYKPPVELELMARVKAALDPENIMNPGKVVAAPPAPVAVAGRAGPHVSTGST